MYVQYIMMVDCQKMVATGRCIVEGYMLPTHATWSPIYNSYMGYNQIIFHSLLFIPCMWWVYRDMGIGSEISLSTFQHSLLKFYIDMAPPFQVACVPLHVCPWIYRYRKLFKRYTCIRGIFLHCCLGVITLPVIGVEVLLQLQLHACDWVQRIWWFLLP